MGVIGNEENELKKSKIRWLIVFLNILANFSLCYCQGAVGVLHNSLKEKFKHLGNDFEFYFNLMYSVNSLPNMIFPFIGGILMTKFGGSLMYFIFGLLILIGQIVFSYGIFYDCIDIVLIGRFIFGLGAGCFFVPQYHIIIKWFPQNQRGFPLGLSISGKKIPFILSNIINPWLVAEYDCNFAIRVGMYISIASFAFTIINIIVDKKGEENLELNKNKIASEITDTESLQSVVIPEKISFKQLPAIFWFTSIFMVFNSGSLSAFDGISSAFLIENFFKDLDKNEAEKKAGMLMSVPLVISLCLIPLFGLFVDRYGKRITISIISSMLSVFVFLSYYFLPPIYGFIIKGICSSTTATVSWNIISNVVKPEANALAVGICESLMNTFSVIDPLILASIYSRFKSYFASLSFFIMMSSVAFIFSILMYIEDKRKNYLINKSNLPDSSIDAATDTLDEKII